MELRRRDGDYVPDGAGGFETLTGAGELLQRALWRLQIPRGSFPFLPELGSELHLLLRAVCGQGPGAGGRDNRQRGPVLRRGGQRHGDSTADRGGDDDDPVGTGGRMIR